MAYSASKNTEKLKPNLDLLNDYEFVHNLSVFGTTKPESAIIM